MKPGKEIAPQGKGQFNTLVQSRTNEVSLQVIKPAVTVSGEGSDLKNTEMLKRKTKKKIITQAMVLSLVDVASRKDQFDWVDTYWNTYHCQNRLVSGGGRLYGHYCKNRFCTVCCGIRKADIMNKYLPIIQTWENPYFVTLTIRAVSASRLNFIVNVGMMRAFRIIKERFRKRNLRGKGPRLIGVKSLECNFNAIRRTYNPHFHIIVPDKKTADALIKEWLRLWTRDHTVSAAQKSRPIENTEHDLMETVKYGSKIFTEPDIKKKGMGKGPRFIYAAALHNILVAMKGHRIFERFGFDLPKDTIRIGSKDSKLNQYDNWEYEPTVGDWTNPESGQTLSGYTPPQELVDILENGIDTELE